MDEDEFGQDEEEYLDDLDAAPGRFSILMPRHAVETCLTSSPTSSTDWVDLTLWLLWYTQAPVLPGCGSAERHAAGVCTGQAYCQSTGAVHEAERSISSQRTVVSMRQTQPRSHRH